MELSPGRKHDQEAMLESRQQMAEFTGSSEAVLAVEMLGPAPKTAFSHLRPFISDKEKSVVDEEIFKEGLEDPEHSNEYLEEFLFQQLIDEKLYITDLGRVALTLIDD